MARSSSPVPPLRGGLARLIVVARVVLAITMLLRRTHLAAAAGILAFLGAAAAVSGAAFAVPHLFIEGPSAVASASVAAADCGRPAPPPAVSNSGAC